MESGKNTILIIEDDKEISAMLSEFLSQNAFVPIAAANGLEGLRLALSESFAAFCST